MYESIPDRKIVLGLGNTLNRDEGLGVHALRALETHLAKKNMNSDLELLDGGTLGLNLLPLVEESSHLLLLDAVNTGKPGGTLIEFTKEQIPLYTGIKLSEHQVTFQEVLALASFRGKLPDHLHLIGIQPIDLSIGIDLSPQISALLPKVVERAVVILRSWNLIADFRGSVEKIRELEIQIADLKKRWPAHSTPPGLMHQLDDLETELENERRKAASS
jgi:hydrogenase maturation protease